MKNNLKAGLIAGLVLILVIGVCGWVTSTPTPTPTAAPTVAPTVTTAPTVAPTAKPAAATDSNTKGIEANWVSKDYTIVTPFIKTTVDGKVAYKGTIRNSNGTSKVTNIMTSTEKEAVSLADTTLANYETQGYSQYKDFGNHTVLLLKGDSMMLVVAYSEIYGTNSPGVGIFEYDLGA